MENYLKQITPAMTKTVDKLKASNFEDATPEEIEIYAEWSKIHALQQAEFASSKEAREKRLAQEIENNQKQAQAAIDALNALANLAQAKLKAVEDGQEK